MTLLHQLEEREVAPPMMRSGRLMKPGRGCVQQRLAHTSVFLHLPFACSTGQSTSELQFVQMSRPVPDFVQTYSEHLPGILRFDVVVAGGTLGIFLACVLQLQGFK